MIDLEQFSTFERVAAIVMAILSLFGVGAIAKFFIERFFKRKDAKMVVHETNEGKAIDADQMALQLMHDDVKDLRQEVKDLRKALDGVSKERVLLEADNKILKASENELKARVGRQGQRIEKLEDDLKDTNILLNEARATILRKENEFVALRGEWRSTIDEVQALRKQVAALEK